MTDAHLPSRWLSDPRMDALTGDAWRVFTYWLMWSNEQGTDGYVPDAALRHLHADGAPAARTEVTKLVAAGIAKRVTGGHLILVWEKSQSTAAQVEHQRERKRRNQQDTRNREKAALSYVTGDVTGDVGGNLPRTGQARQGKYRRSPEQNDAGSRANGLAPVTGHVTDDVGAADRAARP